MKVIFSADAKTETFERHDFSFKHLAPSDVVGYKVEPSEFHRRELSVNQNIWSVMIMKLVF